MRDLPKPQSGAKVRIPAAVRAISGAERGLPSRYPDNLSTPLDFPHAAVAFAASFLAGAINSVAGGGTLVSFPTLIWLGLGSVTANATSTVAI